MMFKDLPVGAWFIWAGDLSLKKSTRTGYLTQAAPWWFYWGMNDPVTMITKEKAASLIEKRLERISGTPRENLIKFAIDKGLLHENRV